MAVDGEGRGPLWVDGRFTVRVRGPEPGRVVRLRRPFALVGRLPGADVRIDDPAVEDRHAFLILDRRGVFGVDLRTRSGTRFAGAAADSARLGAGDIFEVAGRRVELLQLRVDGLAIDPPLSDDDPLAEADPSALASLGLEPLDGPGLPWMLGSALAFAGRGEACAIRVEDGAAAPVHCALLRGPAAAHVIDLLGGPTRLNDRPVYGASALLDGDVLAIGRARFLVRVGPPRGRDGAGGPPPARVAEARPGAPGPAGGLALVPREATPGPAPDGVAPAGVPEAFRQFRSDAASLFEIQGDRIEALRREVAALAQELRGRPAPPAERPGPPRLGLPPRPPSESVESAAWLLDRINGLETEGRSLWGRMVGRITPAIRPGGTPGAPPGDRS